MAWKCPVCYATPSLILYRNTWRVAEQCIVNVDTGGFIPCVAETRTEGRKGDLNLHVMLLLNQLNRDLQLPYFYLIREMG